MTDEPKAKEHAISVLHRLKSDTSGKPGLWGGSVGSRGRAPSLQSKYSMDPWQKWTLVINLGEKHAAGSTSMLPGTW